MEWVMRYVFLGVDFTVLKYKRLTWAGNVIPMGREEEQNFDAGTFC
jgi:hypothetical protein